MEHQAALYMYEWLFTSSLPLAASLSIGAALNYVVVRDVWRQHGRQSYVLRDDWQPPGLAGSVQSDAGKTALPLVGTAVAVLLVFFADRWVRENLIGGLLVVELASLGLNVADLVSVRALGRPGAAEGSIRYSAAYRYKVAAARSLGMGLVVGVVGVVLAVGPLVIGAVVLVATALGWLRRAGQAARSGSVGGDQRPFA